VADVTVVGGGLIGLAGAWRLAQRGASVVVCDPAPLSGAPYAAAGMLAPVTEVHYGEELLLALNIASAARYPGFVAELEDAAGQTVGHRTEGTLAVAFDAGDRAVLEELHAFQTKLHLDAELLDRRECRRLEPMLAPSVHGGLHVAGDHQVGNRRLGKALLAAATRAGVDVRREAVTALTRDGDKVTGVTLATGEQAATGTVVLAAGPWCNDLAGLPRDVPVRPVKGQILRLRTKVPFLTRTVRAVVQGSTVYVVPREDGEIVVGATMEEMGFDTEVRAGAVYDLLRDAHAVLPGIAELELVECRAGLRPGSPDNAPIVGPAAPGLLLATGHFRNGVLLTPITAEAIAAYVVDGTMPDELLPFGPDRFAR
jgi:glycine oxidase